MICITSVKGQKGLLHSRLIQLAVPRPNIGLLDISMACEKAGKSVELSMKTKTKRHTLSYTLRHLVFQCFVVLLLQINFRNNRAIHIHRASLVPYSQHSSVLSAPSHQMSLCITYFVLPSLHMNCPSLPMSFQRSVISPIIVFVCVG